MNAGYTRSETLGDFLVAELERFVDDLEALGELLLLDDERRDDEDPSPAHEGVEAALEELGRDRLHGRRGGLVPGRERLLGATVTNEVEDSEQADGAHVADAGMPFLHLGEMHAHELAHAATVLDQTILLVHADGGDRGGTAERVPGVGEAAGERRGVEEARDLLAHDDRTERRVAAGETFGQDQHIRHDAVVLAGEHLTRAAEAAHDLVEDEQDAELVRERAEALQVARRADEETVRTDHGLRDDGGDRLRPLLQDGVADMRQVDLDRGAVGVAERATVAGRAVDVDETRGARPMHVVARITARVAALARAPVVGAVERHDLGATGHESRHLDGVRDRLGTRVADEALREVAGRDLGELLREHGSRRGTVLRRVEEPPAVDGLVHGGHHLGVVPSDVRVHETGVEVHVATAVQVAEADAIAVVDHDRGVRVRGLRDPGVQEMSRLGRDDFVASPIGEDTLAFHD